MSHRSLVMTSGAKNAGVPKSAGPFVIFFNSRAAPKSANLILPSLDTSILQTQKGKTKEKEYKRA